MDTDGTSNNQQDEAAAVQRVNRDPLTCQKCGAKILNSDKGAIQDTTFELHLFQKPRDPQQPSTETIHEVCVVDDMFDFENIGFSNTVDNVKYLICAVCEIGPIGWHIPQTGKCYIALSRVKSTS